MKKTGLLLLVIIISFVAFAQTQEPAISWEQVVYKFGTFKEEAGPQTATFNFTNTGSKPLFLTNVRASCGCTATEYTKEPVKPGEKGFVKVTYNPRNRPGRFNKSVTVTANTENPTTLLRISGEVTPRVKGIEDYYPKVLDSIRLRTSHLAFNKVFNNQTYTDTLGVVNMGAEPVKLTFERVPAHIKISVTPAVLDAKKPNEKHGGIGYITVVYDAGKKKDWGFVMDRINLIINGVSNSRNRISVSATVEEDFTHLTDDELAKAPKIEFDNTQFEFGTLKQGEKSSNNFTFKNTGKSDLVIRKIRASCGCTATNPEKMVVKPGETSYLTVTFNSNGKRGRQNKTITVITNDPKQPSVVLKVIGNVEQVSH
ncbi:MAG: DUF1573 domain-containing protein [Bacteroidales bacterium]|nr:DUF1573 domain-containing protein [Bacteroidales bacterium]